MFFENDTIMKISENTRYLLIDFWGFSETDNIPNPMLPYYGTVASLNSLQVFLETHEVDKNKIVPELPFYGKHYAIKGNYTRTHHENETACSPFDLFRGTDGLDYSYLEYREVLFFFYVPRHHFPLVHLIVVIKSFDNADLF